MIEENEVEVDLSKPSRATRWLRSATARLRRKDAKMALEAHDFKEEKENRERLAAKRRMEKQQKRKAKREMTTS